MNLLGGLESPANYHVFLVGNSFRGLLVLHLGQVLGGLLLLVDGLGLAWLER